MDPILDCAFNFQLLGSHGSALCAVPFFIQYLSWLYRKDCSCDSLACHGSLYGRFSVDWLIPSLPLIADTLTPHIVASVVDSSSFLHCVPQTKKLSIHSLKLLVNNLMFTKTWKDFVFCVGDTSTPFALLLPLLLLSYVCVWFALCVWMLTLYSTRFMSTWMHMCACMHCRPWPDTGASFLITLLPLETLCHWHSVFMCVLVIYINPGFHSSMAIAPLAEPRQPRHVFMCVYFLVEVLEMASRLGGCCLHCTTASCISDLLCSMVPVAFLPHLKN